MDLVSAHTGDMDHAIQAATTTRIQSRLEATGIVVSRYGLVVVLLLIGVLKFTPEEAAGIQPLVAHSPLMSWMYGLLSVQGASNVIGAIEIATAALMALRTLSPKASFVGSSAAVVNGISQPKTTLMTPLVTRYHFNPSTRYRSASMRWYPNTHVLASGVIRMGPMVSTPAGSDGTSCLQSLR